MFRTLLFTYKKKSNIKFTISLELTFKILFMSTVRLFFGGGGYTVKKEKEIFLIF